MATRLKLVAVNLDCPDARALAAFYQRLTGMQIEDDSNDDFVGLTSGDGFFMGFQRVDDYRAPTWPDQSVPQQLHLDFAVDDIDAAETMVLGLGATKPDFQPDDRWRVLLDPAGHPFCLVHS